VPKCKSFLATEAERKHVRRRARFQQHRDESCHEVFFKEKRRGRVTKRVLFLHVNALAQRALATPKKLAYLGFQCLDHPPYSPHLVPSDYHLLAGVKKQLKVHHFSPDAEVIAAAENWLDGQRSDFFFFEWLAKVRATG